MALSANTVWEVRAAGNDTNGGGFVTGAAGADYSQQNGKRTAGDVTNISTTDAVANGTTTLTSAGANFDANIVGNIIYLQGGTGGLTNVWRQVTARTDASTITLDASVAAGTGITMNIGGALASLGMVGLSATVANMVVHIKNGAYAIGSASNNISGGCFSSVAAIHIFGYNNTRFDFGTRPVLTAGAINTFTVIATAGMIGGIEIDCASRANSRGISSSGSAILVYFCKVSNATNNAFISSGLGGVALCEAAGASSQPAFSAWQYAWGCVAHDGTITAFGGNGSRYVNCIAESNSGATSDGFTSGSALTCINCIAYNNGRDGFRAQAGGSQVIDSIAESNTAGVGINMQALVGQSVINCATFGNATAIVNTGVGSFTLGTVTGTGSFFTNAAGADFTLNANAGAGAAARGAGKLGLFPGTATTGTESIGAAQSSGGGGGGGSGGGGPTLGGAWG